MSDNPSALMGIRVSYLREFIAENGGRSRFDGRSTRDVVEAFILPKTKDKQQCYIDYLRAQPGRVVDIATVFVSHAWDDMFLDLVGELSRHYYSAVMRFIPFYNDFLEEPYVWIDIFCVNQHMKITGLDQWITCFRNAVQDIEYTLLILTEKSITRSWCIFETYTTLMSEGEFVVAITEDPWRILKLLLAVTKNKSVNSDCSNSKDRDQIHEHIRTIGGFPMIDRKIYRAVRATSLKVYAKLALSSMHMVLCKQVFRESGFQGWTAWFLGLTLGMQTNPYSQFPYWFTSQLDKFGAAGIFRMVQRGIACLWIPRLWFIVSQEKNDSFSLVYLYFSLHLPNNPISICVRLWKRWLRGSLGWPEGASK